MASTSRYHPSAAPTTVTTDESITVSIIEAIAAEKGTDLTAVNVQLSDYVDLDALEDLYAHANEKEASDWRVQFHTDEFEVTVHSDGRISVENSSLR